MKLCAYLHAVRPGETVFELRDDEDRLVAAIYATPAGLKVVSKYIDNRPDLAIVDPDDPPALYVNLRRPA